MSRINSIYRTVQSLANKENRGYLTPNDFNNLAKQAQNEIFDGYFYDLNFHLRKATQGGVGSNYSDIPMHIMEKIDQLLIYNSMVTVSDGTGSLPSDLLKLMNVVYNGTIVAMSDPRQIRFMQSSPNGKPTENYPAFFREGNNVNIFPNTIESGVTVDYIRKPKDPQWTYNTIAGGAVFNSTASNYQDFETHESDDHEIVEKILMYTGISIQKPELIEAANGDIQNDQLRESR